MPLPKFLKYLFQIIFLFFWIKAGTAQEKCTLIPTSENATILIPKSINPKLNELPIPSNTYISIVYQRDGVLFCAGGATWENKNLAITIFGKDEISDGLEVEESWFFRFHLETGCVVDSVYFDFSDISSFEISNKFQKDGIYQISQLTGKSFTAEIIKLTDACFSQPLGAAKTVIPVEGNLPYNYLWSNGETKEQIEHLEIGNYSLTVTDNTGCESIDLVEVIRLDQQFIDLGIDTFLCKNTFKKITVPNEFKEIKWNNGESNSVVEIGQTGVFSVTVTDELGCISSDEIVIEVLESPKADLGEDITLCEQEVVRLELSEEFKNYLWSNGSKADHIEVNQSGLYSIIVKNEFGCAATDSIKVQFKSGETFNLSSSNENICLGDQIEIIAYEKDASVNWIDTSNSLVYINDSIVQLSPKYTTEYLTILSNECFLDTFSVNITVNKVNQQVSNDTCILIGNSIELKAKGGIDYEWIDDSKTLSALDISNPIASPTDSSSYVIKITDEYGCEALDTIHIAVLDSPFEAIKLMNTLTPNGDNKNDFLEFYGLEKFTNQNTLRIFNRWGKKLFEKNDYQSDSIRWEGKSKGKLLPGGVYYYTLTLGETTLKQSILLMR